MAALGGFRPHLPCGAASVRRGRACLSSSSVSPARRFARCGAKRLHAPGQHMRRRRNVGCRVGRLDSSPHGLVLAVGEAEDDGGPWLCMALPLRMPSRGLHPGPRHRRLSFSSVFTRVFTLTSSSGGERLPCPEGQDGPLPTPPEPSPTCAASPGLG
jgi:hypothetical protein